jgi:hypothetical protein
VQLGVIRGSATECRGPERITIVTTSSSASVSSSAVSEPVPNSSGRSVSPVGDEPAMRDWASELVERARSEGVELTGDNGLLTALDRQVLQSHDRLVGDGVGRVRAVPGVPRRAAHRRLHDG